MIFDGIARECDHFHAALLEFWHEFCNDAQFGRAHGCIIGGMREENRPPGKKRRRGDRVKNLSPCSVREFSCVLLYSSTVVGSDSSAARPESVRKLGLCPPGVPTRLLHELSAEPFVKFDGTVGRFCSEIWKLVSQVRHLDLLPLEHALGKNFVWHVPPDDSLSSSRPRKKLNYGCGKLALLIGNVSIVDNGKRRDEKQSRHKPPTGKKKDLFPKYGRI